MAYSDNFGQIIQRGHEAREARRQAGEIAQLRYGNRDNGGRTGNDNDELQWLKAGQELAKQEAQLRILGEQQAEQIRQRGDQLFGEYSAAEREAKRTNQVFNGQKWLKLRGYLNMQLEPNNPMTLGQALSQGTGGIINEHGDGVNYTIGSDHDDLVKDNLILSAQNQGYKVDYGAEETTMNLGVDDDLSTKEKFQKFGEQAKNAFTPGSKTNKPLGESHGVTEGANEATPSNSENQTSFEEGEYDSAKEATKSFTIEQIDEAFKNRDFSSFPPDMQKFIRNYLANTYVGYDKQGNPTIFNLAETMNYLTASQNINAVRQEAIDNNLNKAFPALTNFDEQRSMFPGASDDINREQQQYNDTVAAQQISEQQDTYNTLALLPSSQRAENELERRKMTNKLHQDANATLNNPKATYLEKSRAVNLAGSSMENGMLVNPKHIDDNVAIARASNSTPQKPIEYTAKEQLGMGLANNPKAKAILDKHNPDGTKNIDAAIDNVMNNGTPEERAELIEHIKNAVYNNRNVLNSTKATLSTEERKTIDSARNITGMLEQFGTNTEATDWFRSTFQRVIDIMPRDIKNALLGNDKEAQKQTMKKLIPIFAAGASKQGSGATYLSTSLLKELNQMGLNDTAVMQMVDQVYNITQNNLRTLSDSKNDNIYATLAKAENMHNYLNTKRLMTKGAALIDKNIEGDLFMHYTDKDDKEGQPAMKLPNGNIVSLDDDGLVVYYNTSTNKWGPK